MATYAKADNIELFIDRKNAPKAVLRNTLTKEMREFTDITDVKIIGYLEDITLSTEDIAKQLHISKSRVTNIFVPLFEAHFLVDVSNQYELLG
jgi:hypothetical protein